MAVYEPATNTVRIYSPEILFERTLYHERLHSKHFSYKIVRLFFVHKILVIFAVVAFIAIELLTGNYLLSAWIALCLLLMNVAEEFFTQKQTKIWFSDYLKRRG